MLISRLICNDSGLIYEGLKTDSGDRDVMIVLGRKKYLAQNHVLTIKCQNIHFVKNLYVDELRFVSSNFKLMHGACFIACLEMWLRLFFKVFFI